MKIKMKTLQAGPSGIMKPGETHEVDKKLAGDLIDGGYAEPVKEIKSKPEPEKPETPEERVSKPETPEHPGNTENNQPESQEFMNPFGDFGITDGDAELLVAGGITEPDQLIELDQKSLILIKDIGKATAKRILETIDSI